MDEGGGGMRDAGVLRAVHELPNGGAAPEKRPTAQEEARGHRVAGFLPGLGNAPRVQFRSRSGSDVGKICRVQPNVGC